MVEEEVKHAERMATWAAINDLANNDAEHGKKEAFYSPGVSGSPGE